MKQQYNEDRYVQIMAITMEHEHVLKTNIEHGKFVNNDKCITCGWTDPKLTIYHATGCPYTSFKCHCDLMLSACYHTKGLPHKCPVALRKCDTCGVEFPSYVLDNKHHTCKGQCSEILPQTNKKCGRRSIDNSGYCLLHHKTASKTSKKCSVVGCPKVIPSSRDFCAYHFNHR